MPFNEMRVSRQTSFQVLLSLSFSPDSVQTLIDQFDKNKESRQRSH